MEGHGEFLTSKDEWKKILLRSFQKSSPPLHLHPDVTSLYQNGSDECLLFCYQSNSEFFFLPIIQKPIKSSLEGYFDFESPYGYSGPYTEAKAKNFHLLAWKSFLEECQKRNIVAGFLRFHPFLSNHLYFVPKQIKIWEDRPVVVLDLNQSLEQIFNRYKSNTRTHIRKAHKNGYIAQVEKNDLDPFETLYRRSMKRVSADQSYFFRDDYFKIIEKELDHFYDIIHIIKKESSWPVAGAILLYSQNIATIHLSATDYEHQKLGVPSLLRHACVQQAMKKNMRFLNMGGGLTPREDDPLLKFKTSFSKKQYTFYVGSSIIQQTVYDELCHRWAMNGGRSDRKYVLKYRLSLQGQGKKRA